MNSHRPWFFPSSNLLVHWVTSSLTPSLEATPPPKKLVLVNFRLLTSSQLLFNSIFTFSRLTVNPRKDTSRPLTSACRVESINIHFRWLRTCTHNPRTSSPPESFLITTCVSALLIQRLLSAWSINSFIYSISIFFEPFNYVTESMDQINLLGNY